MLGIAISFNKRCSEKPAACFTKQSVVKCEEQTETLSFSRSNMSLINKLQPCILMLRSLGRLCKVFIYIHWQINILVWWSNSTSLFNSSIALVIDGRTRVIQNTPPWLHMTMTHVKGRVEENRDTTIINKYIIAGTIPTIHASNWLIYNLL